MKLSSQRTADSIVYPFRRSSAAAVRPHARIRSGQVTSHRISIAMLTDELRSRIQGLHWGNPDEVQKASINGLLDIPVEDMVFLTPAHHDVCPKFCWMNSAIVLKMVGFPRLTPILPQLLVWFQDLNWPGARTILDLLKGCDKADLVRAIEGLVPQIRAENDGMWAYFLVDLMRCCAVTEGDFNNRNLHSELNSMRQHEEDSA